MQYLLGILMFLISLFLILLVLIQRGRGGGLAGALGGMGGQSAFGTKAGDLFTRITIGTAVVWILVCGLSVRLLNAPKRSAFGDAGPSTPTLTSPSDEGADSSAGGALTPGGSGLSSGALGTEGGGSGDTGTPAATPAESQEK